MTEDWIQRLKEAYEAGYYATEAATGDQTGFPWQNKTCKDCPFWLNDVCKVHAMKRPGDADTCSYFDPVNHAAARGVIDQRMREVWKKWWEQWGRT